MARWRRNVFSSHSVIIGVRTFHDARSKPEYNASGHQSNRVKVSRSQLVHRSDHDWLYRITFHESILLYGQSPHFLPALAVLRDGSTQWISVVDWNITGRTKERSPIDNGDPPRAFGVARLACLWIALACAPWSKRILKTKTANAMRDL